MAEAVFTFFLFVAVIGITAVLFGGWVVVNVLRLVWRAGSAVVGAVPHQRRTSMRHALFQRTCVNSRCNEQNPIDARFCRRCGHRQPNAQRVTVERAAMW